MHSFCENCGDAHGGQCPHAPGEKERRGAVSRDMEKRIADALEAARLAGFECVFVPLDPLAPCVPLAGGVVRKVGG